jgi:hypothetical protein
MCRVTCNLILLLSFAAEASDCTTTKLANLNSHPQYIELGWKTDLVDTTQLFLTRRV